MAITITQQPTALEILSAYRHIVLKCTSDDGDIVKIKAEVFVDTVASGTLLATHIVDPGIGTSVFEVDIQGVAKNRVNHQVQSFSGVALLNASAGVAKDLQIKFTEILKSGNLLVEGTSINSNQFHAVNALRQFTESKDLNNFIFDADGDRFLTNEPNTQQRPRLIRESDVDYLGMLLKDDTYALSRLIVETFDSSGSSIQEVQITGATTDRIKVDWATGPINLNAATLIVGSQPVIDSSVASYSVKMRGNISGNIETELIWYQLDRKCRPDTIRVAFLNSLGAFDTFFFFGTQIERYRIRQSIYQQVIQDNFTTRDRGEDILVSNSWDEFTVYSQLLRPDDKRYLKEFIGSQQVFQDTSDGLLNSYQSIRLLERNFKVIDTNDKFHELLRFTYKPAVNQYSHVA